MKLSSNNFSKRFFISLLSLIPIAQLHAQSVPLREFVIFGKEGATVASSTIEDGAVGSNTFVKTTGGPTLSGNVFSHGYVDFSNNTTIGGKVMVGPMGTTPNLTGNIFQLGSNGLLQRSIYVNGNISIANSTVDEKVVQPAGASYSGPTLALGQRIEANPNIPALPVIAPAPDDPDPASGFTGTGTITNQQIAQGISPGQHGVVALGGNKTLKLKGPGKYYFLAINNSGTNTLEFDFMGASGLFEIYVQGTVNLGKSIVTVTGGGSASRIALKIFGSGTAFNINQGSSGGIQWQGTIFAYNGDINIGSGANASKVLGALFSNKQITMGSSILIDHSPLDPCGLNADAGTGGVLDCQINSVTITGTAKPGVSYLWTAEDGGEVPAPGNTASIQVSKVGTYIFTVTDLGCSYPNYNTISDITYVVYDPCVVPGTIVSPPGGKTNDKIGSELNALFLSNGAVDDTKNAIFQLHPNDPGKVLIDIITRHTHTNYVYGVVTGSGYGMTDTISNGPNSLIITGWYPIVNLLKLNQDISPDFLASKISYVRPVYPAIVKSGTILSGGDSAMGGGIAKLGYGLYGYGVKVGVLSDSYNNLNAAHLDVDAGNLPGVGTLNPIPINPVPVQVLRDYTYAPKSDEGRAMLQIIHDVAPKAQLAFRTGFNTPGDFAVGIKELADAGCNVICDDITYITEPFFRPGVVAQAVSEVVAAGKHYVTAAGNFADKSYETGLFTASGTPPPLGIPGVAHNFGSGIYQEARVRAQPGKPGVYTVVLQWEDEFYSLSNANSPNGSGTDLDMYALDNGGNLIGFNRINIEGDPTEILTFVVNPQPNAIVETEIKLMIVRAAGTGNVRFKFVIFRGDFTFLNPSTGAYASTIVGQGNVPEAVTVGAIRYNITPPWKDTTLVVESFSSLGGTYYNSGSSQGAAQKPDITAPDGVNTSVFMGTEFDPEGDGFKNFFGTSAAAPHVAGAIALLINAKDSFQSAVLTPAEAKTLITSTAKTMYNNGFDFLSGAGLISIDAALGIFANPAPYIAGVIHDVNVPMGSAIKQVTVVGNYFTSSTTLYLNGVELESQFVSAKELTAEIPIFADEQDLTATNPPLINGGTDGGTSNAFSLTGVNKITLKVIANNQTKKFLAALPTFTSSVFKVINGVDVAVTDPAELALYGLSNISYATNATVESNALATAYTITPSRIPNPDPVEEAKLTTFYVYEFSSGSLTIQRLNVSVTPMDITATYGDHIGDIQFNYQILETVVNQTAALELLKASHQAYVSTNAIAVIDGLTQTEVTNLRATLTAEQNKLSLLVTLRALFNARTFSVESNKLVLNTDLASLNRFYIVDLNKVSFQNYLANTGNATLNLQSTLSPNGSGGFISRAMVSQTVLNTNAATVNGYVNALVNAGYMQTLRFMEANAVVAKAPMFNRQFVHQLNGITSGGGGLVQLISGGGGLVQIISGIAQSLPDGQPVILNDGSVIANVNGGGGLVQLISSAGEPIRVPEGEPYTLSNGDQIVNGGGGLLQIISAGGGLLQIISGGGGLLQIISGVPVAPDPVPLTSQVTNGGGGLLQIISTGAPLANARLVLASGGGGLLQIISGGGGLLQIISGGGGLLQLISGGGGLLQIISGGGGLLQLISSASGPIPISNSGAGYGLTSNTATILDETDAAVGNVGPMMGINLVSGLNAGNQFILGGAFLNDNFNVTNGIGELLINKANQTITFTQALPDLTLGDDPITLTATASSGLPVSYTVTGPATISGNVLTITGAGTVSVTATQAGNSNYHAASPVNRSFNVATDPCIITHGTFTNFSTTNGKTTMWVNVKIKLGGELANDGDYLEFKNGTVIFNNITGNFVNNSPIPKGRVEARAGITDPQTTYDPAIKTWITLVPVGFSTSSDIFIAGAIVNSSNGFKKGKNASTAIAGAFRSNVPGFKTHWLFGMGAYQSSVVDIFAVFTLASLQGMNQVIPVNGTYKSGTPVPHIAHIVNGGTGSGPNNFAGNTSSLDQFNACIVTPALAPVTMQREMPVQKMDAQLILAPNPARNAFNLSFVPSVTGQTTIRIFTINGALISEEFAGMAEGGQLYTRQVKSHAYRPGMYLVQMVNQGQVITRKLVIMNDR